MTPAAAPEDASCSSDDTEAVEYSIPWNDVIS